MLEHFIFDFDGTISDSYPIFVQIFHEIAQKHGYAFNLSDGELDRRLRVNVKTGFCGLGWDKECDWKSFLEEFHAHQEAHALDFRAFPEAVELLGRISERGKKIYLYTHSGAIVRDILKNMGLLDYFAFILDNSYGFPSKPAPDALLFFLEKLALDPKTCLMIGDRPIDANAGMNAGMKGCLWDPYGLYPDAEVDYCVRTLSEVENMI